MKKDNNSDIAGILRQKAEAILDKKFTKGSLPLSEVESIKLVHELEVHQIELELQNEDLELANDQAAEHASRKYAELFDFAPLGYFSISKESEIIEVNLCGAQMLGKERSKLRFSNFCFFVSDNSKTIFHLFLEKVFNSKTKQTCEVVLTVGDAMPVSVLLNGIISENSEQCLVTATDIDELKAADEALKKSQELYADLVSNQTAGIYRILVQKPESGKSILDSTRIEFVNDRFCEIVEIDPLEFLNNEIAKFFGRIHPDDIEEFIKSNEIAQQEFKPYFMESRLLIGDRIKWMRFESCARRLEDGSTRWTGIAIDITDRKKAEEAVRMNEEKYRMLLEFATDAFFQGDENGNLIIVNSVAIELTGFSRDELLKMNMKDLFSTETLNEKPLKYAQVKKGEIVKSERELVCKDKKAVIVEMNSRMMPDGTFQSFFRDITDRKTIEAALNRKLSELEIYYDLAITRERKMIALKSEINLLLERLGEKLKY